MEEKENFWKTKRGKATIKLGVWLLALGSLCCFLMLFQTPTIEKKEKNDEEVKISYKEMQNNLSKENFSFNYKISIQNKIYTFNGDSDGDVITGYKENNEEIIKYFINKEDIVYKVSLNENIIIDNLYEEINPNYISIKYIIELLNDAKYEESSKDKLKEYVYDFEECDMRVTTDEKEIKEIVIISREDEYRLSFTNIGKVDKIESIS